MRRGILLLICCAALANITGCTYKNREEYLQKSVKANKEQADIMMQSIMDALEAQNAEDLKDLFSAYALEQAEDIDEKIEQLMEFYPGYSDGIEGNYDTHESNDYGDKICVLNGKYTISNDTQNYQIKFTTQIRNDREPDKVGLYLIEIMTEDAKSEGFKWRDEEDAPGIYVLE